MGYRVDFSKLKIVETGGIYVRTFPAADTVTIDNQQTLRMGLFANSIFIPKIIPNDHTVAIAKDGYFSYQKTLPVVEKEVTKLENVYLFKQNPIFSLVPETTTTAFDQEPVLEKYVVKSGSLYFANIPANQALDTKTPLQKNVVAFSISGSNILWLGSDGVLYRTPANAFPLPKGEKPTPVTESKIRITANTQYDILENSQDLFVNNGGYLLHLNQDADTWDLIASGVDQLQLSPNQKYLAFTSNLGVTLLPLQSAKADDTSAHVLYQNAPATGLQWLNDFYLVFANNNAIVITESDWRGTVNTAALPNPATLDDGTTTALEAPEIIFDRGQGRLYVKTGKQVLESEKLF